MRNFRGSNPGAIDDPKVRDVAAEHEAQLRELTNALARLGRGEVPDAAGTILITETGGVTDHGALTGLLDDDHTQYAKLTGRTTDTQVWKASGTTWLTADAANTRLQIAIGNATVTIKQDSIIQTDGVGTSTLTVRGDAALELGTGGNTAMCILQSSSLSSPQIAIRSNSGQTGNIMEWQTSGGTALAYVDKDGNFSGGAGGTSWKVVPKTADETITADATLNNDAALLFAAAANTKYAFRISAFYSSPVAAGMQFTITCPAAATQIRWAYHFVLSGGSTGAGLETTSGSASSIGGAASNGSVVIEGILQNGANAGNVNFQWAQQISNGGDTTVFAGATLQYKSL